MASAEASSKKTEEKKKISAPEARTCGNCGGADGSAGVAKHLACARCGLVFYCSKDCQLSDWKANHKKCCIAKADRLPQPRAPLTALRVERGKASWSALTKDEQRELQMAVDGLRAAAAQGHALAQYNLGFMLVKGRGVAQSDVVAARWMDWGSGVGNAVMTFTRSPASISTIDQGRGALAQPPHNVLF
jgi:hypothetical protein